MPVRTCARDRPRRRPAPLAAAGLAVGLALGVPADAVTGRAGEGRVTGVRRPGVSERAAGQAPRGSARPSARPSPTRVGGRAAGQAPRLTFDAPTGWIAEPVASPRPASRFILPKAPGDGEDAVLDVVPVDDPDGTVEDGGADGPIAAHLERWIDQMLQPDGRRSADAAITTTFTVGELPVTVLDLAGIYAAVVRPGSLVRYHKPAFRLLGAVVETPDGLWLFTLTGPAQTVAVWHDRFIALLESVRFE